MVSMTPTLFLSNLTPTTINGCTQLPLLVDALRIKIEEITRSSLEVLQVYDLSYSLGRSNSIHIAPEERKLIREAPAKLIKAREKKDAIMAALNSARNGTLSDLERVRLNEFKGELSSSFGPSRTGLMIERVIALVSGSVVGASENGTGSAAPTTTVATVATAATTTAPETTTSTNNTAITSTTTTRTS